MLCFLFSSSIITTLETLKKEAAEVTRKVEETDVVMAEVETVSQQYLSLAQSCSSIYFTLEALNRVSVHEVLSQNTECSDRCCTALKFHHEGFE